MLTNDMDQCMFAGSKVVERHHVFGGADRSKSEKYDFIVPLRPDLHPNGVHFIRTEENLKIDKILKQRCQEYFEENCGTREEFIQEFGRNYL